MSHVSKKRCPAKMKHNTWPPGYDALPQCRKKRHEGCGMCREHCPYEPKCKK